MRFFKKDPILVVMATQYLANAQLIPTNTRPKSNNWMHNWTWEFDWYVIAVTKSILLTYPDWRVSKYMRTLQHWFENSRMNVG